VTCNPASDSVNAWPIRTTVSATAASTSSWCPTRGARSSASAGAPARIRLTRVTHGCRSSAVLATSREVLRRHRVGLAQLRDVGGIVGLAYLAAEHEHADTLIARPDLAGDAGTDPGDVVGVEWEALSLDLDLAAAAEGHVDLLLAVLLVVVHGVVVVVGRHVDDLHPERFDPELGPGPLEGSPEDGLHLVDPLHRVSAHLLRPPDLCGPGWAGSQASCRTLYFQARLPPHRRTSNRLASG